MTSFLVAFFRFLSNTGDDEMFDEAMRRLGVAEAMANQLYTENKEDGLVVGQQYKLTISHHPDVYVQDV